MSATNLKLGEGIADQMRLHAPGVFKGEPKHCAEAINTLAVTVAGILSIIMASHGQQAAEIALKQFGDRMVEDIEAISAGAAVLQGEITRR